MASREEDIGSSALEGGAPTHTVPPDRVFEAKPIWKRMVVILAGVTMNALFAWAVFAFQTESHGMTRGVADFRRLNLDDVRAHVT